MPFTSASRLAKTPITKMVDHLIIGGGVTGAATAYHLTKLQVCPLTDFSGFFNTPHGVAEMLSKVRSKSFISEPLEGQDETHLLHNKSHIFTNKKPTQ